MLTLWTNNGSMKDILNTSSLAFQIVRLPTIVCNLLLYVTNFCIKLPNISLQRINLGFVLFVLAINVSVLIIIFFHTFLQVSFQRPNILLRKGNVLFQFAKFILSSIEGFNILSQLILEIPNRLQLIFIKQLYDGLVCHNHRIVRTFQFLQGFPNIIQYLEPLLRLFYTFLSFANLGALQTNLFLQPLNSDCT